MRFCNSKAVEDAVVAKLSELSQQCSCLVVQHFVLGEVPAAWFPAAQGAMDLCFELAQQGKKAVDVAHRAPDKARSSRSGLRGLRA